MMAKWLKADLYGPVGRVFAIAFPALLAASLLSACAVSTPVSIASTSGQLPPQAAVQVAPVEEDNSLRATFATALKNALASQIASLGSASNSTAPVIAEFAIAMRDAKTGVADPAESDAAAIAWESRPRNHHIFDNCSAQRLRATLVLLNREDGQMLYRGVGEADACNYSNAQMAELARALVTDAQGTAARP